MGLIRQPKNSMVAPVVPGRAFVTDDAAAILHFALEGFDRLAASALVTLVGVKGGAARAIGAQMAVHGDGAFCGFVSGGCTEAAVAACSDDLVEARGQRQHHHGLGRGYGPPDMCH